MSDCPEISTLISFALNPDVAENAEIAAHVFDCPKCQKDMEIIHETMLADKWSKPQIERDQYLMAACKSQEFELKIDQAGNYISTTKGKS